MARSCMRTEHCRPYLLYWHVTRLCTQSQRLSLCLVSSPGSDLSRMVQGEAQLVSVCGNLKRPNGVPTRCHSDVNAHPLL